MSNKKVLIIEDEKGLSEALATRLSTAGFTTSVAYDGKQALETLGNEHFDVVLLDLIMPVLDGWQVLMQLGALNIRTIVISNLSGADNIRRAKEMGAEEYIEKASTTLEDLITKVVKLLELKFPEPPKAA